MTGDSSPIKRERVGRHSAVPVYAGNALGKHVEQPDARRNGSGPELSVLVA